MGRTHRMFTPALKSSASQTTTAVISGRQGDFWGGGMLSSVMVLSKHQFKEKKTKQYKINYFTETQISNITRLCHSQ